MNKVFSAAQDPKIFDYVHSVFQPEDSVLSEIRSRSRTAGLPPIHLGAMDGRHLELFTRMVQAKKVLEIGTLGGYSGVCLARGLQQPGGKLWTIEVDEANAQVARESFARAGVGHSVEVLVGPALDHLPGLVTRGPYDLVFIDADKVNYPNYLKWAAQNVRVGGAIVGDNSLGFGKIASALDDQDPDFHGVLALREFNQTLASHPNFRATLVPTGEGMTLAIRVK